MSESKFAVGAFTPEELAIHNDRLLHLLQGAMWSPERGLIYLLFFYLRAHYMNGSSLEEVQQEITSVWSAVLQMESRLYDSKGNPS